MIWSGRGGGWSLNREGFGGGGVANVMRDEEGEGGVAAGA